MTVFELASQHQQELMVFFGGIVAFYLLRSFLIHHLRRLSEKTTSSLDDIAVEMIETVGFPVAFVVSLAAALFMAGLTLNDMKGFNIVLIFLVTWQLTKVVNVLFRHGMATFTKNNGGLESVQGLKTVINILVWIGGLMFTLSALEYDISSLVAGLGIGGIAIALALQTILGDIFSSFSIYFDQPFSAGDYIVTPHGEGTVERIGLKTTRLRSLRGEEVVIANKDLTSSAIQNFGLLKRRRVVVSLGVTYGTPNEKIEKIRADFSALLGAVESVSFDRIHFKRFGASSLDMELVYYVESSDYMAYVNVEHAVNLKMKEWFEEHQVEMAFPTQTVYVEKSGS